MVKRPFNFVHDITKIYQAGGSVTCGKVGGDIMAGESVRHG